MPTNTPFNPKVFQLWWKKLSAGDISGLKHCQTPDAAYWVPAYHALFNRCPGMDKERLAAFAILAAHTCSPTFSEAQDTGTTLPVNLRALQLNEDQFKLLLGCETPTDFLLRLRPQIPRVSRGIDLTRLAHDIVFWSIHVKRRWAFDFYANSKEEEIENNG